MVKEARSAYRRRDEELAQRRNQVEAAASGANGDTGSRRGERSWWDSTGLDGAGDLPAMSPVTEEGNPMEDVTVSNKDARSKDANSIPESEVTLKNSDTSRSRDTSEEVETIKEEEDSTLKSKKEGK
jgi:G protein-coupled receptor GPR1